MGYSSNASPPHFSERVPGSQFSPFKTPPTPCVHQLPASELAAEWNGSLNLSGVVDHTLPVDSIDPYRIHATSFSNCISDVTKMEQWRVYTLTWIHSTCTAAEMSSVSCERAAMMFHAYIYHVATGGDTATGSKSNTSKTKSNGAKRKVPKRRKSRATTDASHDTFNEKDLAMIAAMCVLIASKCEDTTRYIIHLGEFHQSEPTFKERAVNLNDAILQSIGGRVPSVTPLGWVVRIMRECYSPPNRLNLRRANATSISSPLTPRVDNAHRRRCSGHTNSKWAPPDQLVSLFVTAKSRLWALVLYPNKCERDPRRQALIVLALDVNRDVLDLDAFYTLWENEDIPEADVATIQTYLESLQCTMSSLESPATPTTTTATATLSSPAAAAATNSPRIAQCAQSSSPLLFFK